MTGRVFLRWLRARLAALVWLALAACIFALVLHLYRAPVQAALYAGLICLVLLCLAGGADYARYLARHRALQRLMQALPESLTHLPAANGLLEQDYQQLLTQLAQLHAQAVTGQDARYQRLVSTITRWSHQIKTPISAQQLLLQRVDSAQRMPLQDELNKISRQVDMLLNYFKLDAGADDFLFAPTALKPVVAEAVRRHARLFVLKHLRLTVTVPEDVQVVTDGKLLGFALDQLISNAIKYTQEGGITIVWTAHSRTLTVQDTGIGIAAQDLPRVTEHGFTGTTGHQDTNATGIGLYLCRRACERLDITLMLASQPGQGTRAQLIFPLTPQPKD